MNRTALLVIQRSTPLAGGKRARSPYFAPGSPGIQLHPALTVLPGELLL